MKKLRSLLFSFSFATLLVAGLAGTACAQEERVIKFGHLNNTDHPVSFGVKRFAELLARKSGGKIVVKEYPASTHGNELQQQSALQGGVQEMSAPATTSLAGIVKEFGLLDFPFAVANFAQADALLDGPFGQALMARLPEKGLVALGYWDLGFRNVTNGRRPITRPEDLDGLKLRVIPNPVFLDTFKAFKANPVPMPFAELYGALESKAIDGQENPFSVILSNKFYEVQKYVSATNHVYAANILLVSKRFWDRLTPAEQKMMNEAAAESREYQRQNSRAAGQKAVGELQANGMQFNELSAVEHNRMVQVARPVTDRLAAELGLASDFRQTNHEGVLVDWIQEAFEKDAAVIINPAGFSFGCVPVLDALKMIRRPLIEVHITNIHQRPQPYTHSLVSQAATGVICGLGPGGYLLAVRAIAEALAAPAAAVTGL